MTSTTHNSNGHSDISLADLLEDRKLDIPQPPRVLYHAAELSALPPALDLIPGVLQTNKLAQIFGQPGQGKTFVNLDIALSVAQFTNVVYIAAEAPEEYYERIQAWCTHHKSGPGGLYIWTQPVNLMDRASVDAFLQQTSPLYPELLIVDPLASCMVGYNDSDFQDMSVAIESMNYIRRTTNAAILICHHAGWSAEHERGSSALRAACRIVMKVSNNGDGLVTLSCEKNNSGKKFDKRLFNLIPASDSAVLVPTSRMSDRNGPITEKQLDVLEALTLAHFADGVTFGQIVEHLSIAKSTLNGILDKLHQRGYVKFEGSGNNKRYLINESGRDTLLSRASESVQEMTYTRADGTEQRLNWHVETGALRSGGVRP